MLHIAERVLDDRPFDVHGERRELLVQRAKAIKKASVAAELHEDLRASVL